MFLGKFLAVLAVGLTVLSSCSTTNNQAKSPGDEDWNVFLEDVLPMLGHRNWIVITDMAYPLQSGEGITTLYADEPYLEVLKTVNEKIKAAPHVFAHVYNDKELEYITEEMVPGIGELRSGIRSICGPEAKSVMHEELISRLDEAGK